MRFLRWLFDTREWMGWRVECWYWIERHYDKIMHRTYRLGEDIEHVGKAIQDVAYGSMYFPSSYFYRKRKAAENRRPA